MKYRRIRDLREDSDKSQKALSEHLNIARTTYASYENGYRSIPSEIWSDLADYYDTSVDFLMGRTDEKESYPQKKK